MKQPPAIQPAPVPGPDFDPLDWIIEDWDNIESFLGYLAMNPHDLTYLNTHLPSILALRRTLSHHLDMLADEPYNYPPSRLKILHEENEKVFIFLEGVVGALDPWDEVAFKKAVKATEETLLKLDRDVTPP
jgi:hypothetical protein